MVDDTTSLLLMKLLQLYLAMAHRSLIKIDRLCFTYRVVVYDKSAISIIHIQLYTMCCSFHKERMDGISIFPFKIFLDGIIDPNMSPVTTGSPRQLGDRTETVRRSKRS